MSRTINQVNKMYKDCHPDGKTSKEAKQAFLTVWKAGMSDDDFWIVIDLAGDIARWQDRKAVCTDEHVARAVEYLRTNTVELAKTLHEINRSSWITIKTDIKDLYHT